MHKYAAADFYTIGKWHKSNSSEFVRQIQLEPIIMIWDLKSVKNNKLNSRKTVLILGSR
jgi:hypothetical protein